MPAALNITVVEDHDELRALTVAVLQGHGHQVTGLASAEALASGSPAAQADLYVLDLMLPGQDGLQLAQRLRQARPDVGIVMVTARTQLQQRLQGYAHGADLYLTKPVAPEELLSAVAALARRLAPVVPAEETAYTLDSVSLCLSGPAGTAELTASEATMLRALASAPQRRLGTLRLAELASPELAVGSKASLEVRLVRLRKKLVAAGAGPRALMAVRGQGYQLCIKLVLKL